MRKQKFSPSFIYASIVSIFFSIGLLQSSIYDVQPFSPDRMNAFYDLFVAEQASLVDDGISQSLDVTAVPPPGMLGYAPLVITNNTGLAASRLYVVGKGQKLAATDAYFLKPNLSTGVCSLVSGATNNSADPTISVQLSQLPSAGINSYYIYIPQIISGRFYISVDFPLYMETSTAAGTGYITISDPSQTSTQDPNYYTLYQDFELTLDKNYDLYANVTNVDYFALPLTLGSYTYPTGAYYPTLDNLTVVGYPYSSPRSSILTNIINGLANGDASSPKQWNNLSIPFYTNPYVTSSPATYLRILTAKQSIGLASGYLFQGAATAQGFFSSTYLQNSLTGPVATESYMTALYNYYNTAGNQLEFTIFPSNQPTATYTMTSSASSLILNFTSTSPSAVSPITVNLNNLTTKSLLDGAIGEWVQENAITPTNTDPWQTEIAKLLSALFSAGMLPPASTVNQPIISSDTYFANYRSSYFSNPSGFSLYGPWYNLFDKVVHPLLIYTNGFGLGYAYDFDDLLDIAGLLHVNIQTSGQLNPYQPYYILTADLIDTTIPNPTVNFGPYNLHVSLLPVSGYPIDIIYSTSSSAAPTTVYSADTGSTGSLIGLYNDFLVKYYTDNTKTAYYTYKVYPKYQLVLPTTNRYNSLDVKYMNGLVFISPTNGTNFYINLPDTRSF